MNINQDTPFQKAIDAVEALPFDEREELLEVLKMRLIEDRREEIAANAQQAIQDVKEGKAIVGTVEDLRRDLLNR
jgi:hypothetical protein